MSFAAFAQMEPTWPAALREQFGPFVLRRAQGGGGRVNSASFEEVVSQEQLQAAMSQMRALGVPPSFIVTAPWQDALLQEAGLEMGEEVLILAGDLPVAHAPSYEALWPAPEAAIEIWEAGGIGAPRREVMAQVACPKAAIVLTEAVLFAAVAGETVMVHAVEVAQDARGRGLGRQVMLAAADWAHKQGAKRMMLAVTAQNVPALGLYHSLGLSRLGAYWYRLA